jgi:hypothetical protein
MKNQGAPDNQQINKNFTLSRFLPHFFPLFATNYHFYPPFTQSDSIKGV